MTHESSLTVMTLQASAGPDSDSDYDSLISQMCKNCASITEHALSLKTLVPFKDIDTAIDEERDLAKWLDRQLLDYNDKKSTEQLEGSSFDMNFATPRSQLDVKQLRTNLMEQTWNQHFLHHLFISRIRMASSAQAALGSANDLASLTMEPLQSRDLLVDQVTKCQHELVQVRERLEAVTRQARIAQDENRALWTDSNAQTVVATDTNAHPRGGGHEEANLRQQKQLIKYTNERIAKTFLKLAD